VIFADHDAAGKKAAERLAQRLLTEERSFKMLYPPDAGQDWADVLIEHRSQGNTHVTS
jgi:DNA primase